MAGWLCPARKDKMLERCSSILQDHLILIKLESTCANTTLAETEESSMIQGYSSFSSATPPTTQLTEGAHPARSSSKTTGITDATQFALDMSQGKVIRSKSFRNVAQIALKCYSRP